MDPVTIGAVLAAVAGGAGGALGAQVWQGACALVRRPLRQAKPEQRSGEAELAALGQARGDQRLAVELATVLIGRSERDPEFGEALTAWWEQARQVRTGAAATNAITGGTFTGPVLQGQNFTRVNFGSPPSAGAGE